MGAEMLSTGRSVAINGQVVGGVALPAQRDPEVQPKARRRFTVAYKLGILSQADRCGPGEVGILLRREGLYSSHLTKWRRQQATGALRTAGHKRAGAAEELRTALQQLAKAERENRQLRGRLERAETIISVQKKLSSLLQPGLLEVEY